MSSIDKALNELRQAFEQRDIDLPLSIQVDLDSWLAIERACDFDFFVNDADGTKQISGFRFVVAESEPPTYARQTSDAEHFVDDDAKFKWLSAASDEAKAEGNTYIRASFNEEPKALLLEGWPKQPKVEPRPRWYFKAESNEKEQVE